MPQPDWLLYVADCDAVGALIVRAAGRNGDHDHNRGVRDLGDARLHRIGCGARELRGRAPGTHHVCLLFDLHALFHACGLLIFAGLVR